MEVDVSEFEFLTTLEISSFSFLSICLLYFNLFIYCSHSTFEIVDMLITD